MAAHVLVVEREGPLREAITRSIEALPGVEVRGADSVAQALSRPDESPPDAVVMDLRAPEELVAALLSKIGAGASQIPVIMVCSEHAEENPDPGRRLDLAGLRRLVRNALQSTAAPHAAPPPPFTLDEYLQLASFGRHSVRVNVRVPEGPVGEVIVWEGDVCTARDRGGEGPDAFRRLATGALRGGAVITCEGIRSEPASRTLEPGQWQALLFDTARLHDEGISVAAGAHETMEMPAVDDGGLVIPMPGIEAPTLDDDPPPLGGAEFDDLVERGVDALLRKDHALALSYFEDAESVRPGSPFVRGNISRLREVLEHRV